MTLAPAIEPYAAFPVAALKARIQELDSQGVCEAVGRKHCLPGEIELKRSGMLLVGSGRATNTAHGPTTRARCRCRAAREVRTDVRTCVRSPSMRTSDRAGAVTGSGSLTNDAATVALATRNLDLSGLHGRMRKTRLAGRADLTLTEAQQSVAADLSQDDINVAVTAHRAGDRVQVSQFRARARGGEHADRRT